MVEVQVRALMALARAKALTVQQNNDQKHRDLVPILAAWFGSKAAIGAKRLPDEIVAELVGAGFDPDAVARAGEIVLNHPLSGRTRGGSPEPKPGSAATRMVAAGEPDMRAQYLLAAAERLTEAQQDGDVDAAAKREETYAAQHAAAGRNRRTAAKKLDDLAGGNDQLLVWRTAGDDRVTPDCAALSGRIFHASNPPGIPGAMHPRCLLPGTVVAAPGLRATTTRWYSGEVVELLTCSGDVLAVTPNHPILTPQGWVAAGLLDEGREIVRAGLSEALVRLVDPDNYQRPALIEDVVASFSERSGMLSAAVPVAAEDFHGDGSGSEIAVVRADGELWNGFDPAQLQPRGVEQFSGVGSRLPVAPLGGGALLFPRMLNAANSRMSRLDVAGVLVGGPRAHHDAVGFSLTAPGDPAVAEDLGNGLPGDTMGPGELVLAHPGFVSAANVTRRQTGFEDPRHFTSGASPVVGFGLSSVSASLPEASNQLLFGNARLSSKGIRSDVAGLVEFSCLKKVRRYSRWNGHVYNLMTSTGWYVSDNIVTHNCRCTAETWGQPGPLLNWGIPS